MYLSFSKLKKNIIDESINEYNLEGKLDKEKSEANFLKKYGNPDYYPYIDNSIIYTYTKKTNTIMCEFGYLFSKIFDKINKFAIEHNIKTINFDSYNVAKKKVIFSSEIKKILIPYKRTMELIQKHYNDLNILNDKEEENILDIDDINVIEDFYDMMVNASDNGLITIG